MSTPSSAVSPSQTELLAVAVKAAQTAAHYAVHERARCQDANLIDQHDIKLKLDVECQQIVTQTILAAFPSHTILGEEDASYTPPPPDAYEWVVDPIDGTVNFFHGNPFWCCSVAVRQNGTFLASCVCAPDINQLYTATREGDARCNDRVLHVSKTADLASAMINMGLDKMASQEASATRFFNALVPHIQRARICGAAALDICLLAAGAADGYFEPGIYIWDIAAANLILQRAGGQGEILREFGHNKLAFLGSNTTLHQPLKDILNPLL